ncbi:MAG TPA: HAD family phosphatase [Bacteroidetes bacterium]|nr:HAD family phosphatase [Bacteroidota bacterium]
MNKISTIIFDLGGVILDLDQGKTLRAFARKGLDLEDVNEASPIFTDFETGKITAADFRQGIKSLFKGNITDTEIDEAWNAMLLDTCEERFRIIEGLRKQFRIYLLSNTNSIHIDFVRDYLNKHFSIERWDNLFDKQYLSYEIGLRKPNKNIYEYVLSDIQKQPQECLFIDDSFANIKGAESAGIQTLLALNPLDQEMLSNIKQIVSSLKR